MVGVCSVLFQGVLISELPLVSKNIIISISGIDNLFAVTTALEDVATKWRSIGLALGLRDADLGALLTEGKSVYECLTDMLRLWLNQSHDVIKSWQMLEKAVRARAGGNNPALADQIHRKYTKACM